MAIVRRTTGSDMMRPFFDTFFEQLGAGARLPETDVTETENAIRVTMDVPGMRSDDIDVELENNVLTISGDKHEEREEKTEEGRLHLAERRWGHFARSFVLPREVEADRIQAAYRDGVLDVTIPKAESARRRRIDVAASEAGEELSSRRIEEKSGQGRAMGSGPGRGVGARGA